MIDIGLSQIALISGVALVVVGPERLPKVARMAGHLLGRARRYMNEVKSEVSREIELDEFRKLGKDMQSAASDVRQDVEQSLALATAGDTVEWSAAVAQAPERVALSPDWVARKAKNFRKKKLALSPAVSTSHKRQNTGRTNAASLAARAGKRPHGATAAGFFG